MKSFTIWISRRLRLSGTKRGANSVGVVIAVTGVAIAIIVMLLTISVVLGFKHQVTQRIMGFDGELWIMPDYNYADGTSAPTLVIDSTIVANVEKAAPGSSMSLQFNQPGILKTETDFAGVYFTGYDANHSLSFEQGNIIEGVYPDYFDSDNANKIVISNTTAKSLGLKLGDKIHACFFVNDAIKARKFEIAGIYESGFGEYDRTVVYAGLSALQRIAAVDSVSGTRVSITLPGDRTDEISSIAQDLQTCLLDDYQNEKADKLYPVDNVMHTGAIYFGWLGLLDTNVVVIFILMLCVSGFTLISSMFIIILDRIPTIGVLRSLGASKKQIRHIFVFMTLRIVGMGMLIGNVVGLGLMYIQKTFKILTLDPEMYYLKYVPIEINWPYFIYLNLGVIFISWLILILPSRVAGSISPASTMRFE